jgi:SAM-dependent methyltransferase
VSPGQFGTGYAGAYDGLYADKDYPGEVDLLVRLFDEHAAAPPREIVDLGCGTGGHALELAARGYSPFGVDRSSEMLAVAREKAAQRQLEIPFAQADVRQLDLGRTFDAAVLMFAVLGYQLENSDVLDTLAAARRHLQPGGLLVADFWYGPAVLHERPGEREKRFTVAGKEVVRLSRGTLDSRRHRCTVVFSLGSASSPDEIVETHEMRFFFPLEIELLLCTAAFELLELSTFPEREKPDESSWNVFVVARAT